MAISFQTFDLDTVIIASLEIERIPLKVGRYELRKSDSQSPNSIYWIGYDDETDALYSLDGSQGGSVWVDAYDPVKKTIKGRFQAYFYRERSDLFNYPEEVSFEDGEFEVRLWQ